MRDIYIKYQAIAESLEIIRLAGYDLRNPIYVILYFEKQRLGKLIDEDD